MHFTDRDPGREFMPGNGSLFLFGAIALFAGVILTTVFVGCRPKEQKSSVMAELDSMDDDLDPVNEDTKRLHTTLGLPDPKLYPPVPMAKIAPRDGWGRPRALLRGKVTYLKLEADGDNHFLIEDGPDKVVCEQIPELVMPNGLPKVGDKIIVWGIVRYDGQHGGWAELHPAINWKPQ